MNKVRLKFLLLLLLGITFPGGAIKAASKGETINDLFRLYNKNQTESTLSLKAEYVEAKKEYESKKLEIAEAEAYNKVYESAKEYQEKKKQELEHKISTILQQNKEIADKIKKDLSGNWEALLTMDAQYKINVGYANDLLLQKDKYTLSSKQAIDYGALKGLKDSVEVASVLYQEVANSNLLGDVTSVHYPLNAPTTITSNFGNRLDPIRKTSVKFHAGIDLAAQTGTEVLALFKGTVSATGYSPSGGYFVSIEHGEGIRTYYCHLSEIKCQVGDSVAQYKVIALSGNSGSRTTGPHLHLGLYFNGVAVDPGILF